MRKLDLSLSSDLPRHPVKLGADVADLAFLAGDSVAKRSLDLFLVYTQSFQETVTTIESEEITVGVRPQ